MVTVTFDPRRPDLLTLWDVPYTLRLYDVTEAMFDEVVDEDTRADLIDGVMIVHSPASIKHDDIGGFARALMRCYASRRKLGNVLGPDSMVHLATCRRVAPDTFFVRRGRMPRPRPKVFKGVPDLMLEVLSPSNRREDLNDKLPAYRQAAVKEIWVIDLEKEHVVVERKRGRRYIEEVVSEGRVTSAVLDGFWLDVSWLWNDPLPDEMDCLQLILGEGDSAGK